MNVYLWGESGTGKSHLLQAACTLAAASDRKAIYLPLKGEAGITPELLQDVDTLDLVCIDDIDRAAGIAQWEMAIFNLYNRLQSGKRTLVVSADAPPAGIPVALPDLKSRLSAAIAWHLSPLSEAERLQALQQRAKVRGFELPDEVMDFLSRRVARDMHTLFDWLDRMDIASLSQQKKLSVPFVRALLNGKKSG